MINKILIIIWFAFRPKFYLHFFSLIYRKFLFDHDTYLKRAEAHKWAADNAISYSDALEKLNLVGEATGLDKHTINESRKLEAMSSQKMGGAANIHLLYDCVKLIKAQNVIETGVAYGWSSLAILKALHEMKSGKLISVDMPYPRKSNDSDIGIVVPDYLKKSWILIRKPDRPGIREALSKFDGLLDLCHYDSDKSWWGRDYAYPILWKSLKSNGLFISDDIEDNLYFSEFVKNKSSKFAVIEFNGKFVGLIRKP